METIASRKNPLILLARRVAEGDPQDRGRMLLDGLHLVEEARSRRDRGQTAAFSTQALAAADGEARRLATSLGHVGCRVVQVSDAVMEAISPTAHPSGIVAVATRPRHELDAVLPAAHGDAADLVVVDVQDPGNLGAIVRVAEAAGATGVIAWRPVADPFGWKALRGAMGSAFRLPVVREPQTLETLQRLKEAASACWRGSGEIGPGVQFATRDAVRSSADRRLRDSARRRGPGTVAGAGRVGGWTHFDSDAAAGGIAERGRLGGGHHLRGTTTTYPRS